MQQPMQTGLYLKMKKISIKQDGEADNRMIMIISLLIMMLLYISLGFAIPPIATEFFGIATLNLTNVSQGVNITAYDSDNISCGSFIVVNEGYYGILSCNGDDTSTSTDEGAFHGDSISFYINSTRMTVIGNTTWEEGVFHFVNITSANIAPIFDFNLTSQYANESSAFLFDVNCSDTNPIDIITYSDNTSLFDINSNTGYINWTPSDSEVGYHSVLIICSDSKDSISQVLSITIYDVNNPPFLFSIGPQLAIESQLFTLYLYANDSDRNDNLTFSVNSSLFGVTTINYSHSNGIALINFTPSLAQIGNYSLTISVNDNILTTSEIIPFTIVRGPYCGDSSCGSSESCGTCTNDCGACPPSSGESGDGNGETGEGAVAGGESGQGNVGGVRSAIGRVQRTVSGLYRVCNEKWECSEWTMCNRDGIQTKACKDVNTCGAVKKKPKEIQNCIYIGTCIDGIRNNNEEGIDCGGPCKLCITSTCTDSIQNQGEEGIDCGGPCKLCTIKKFAKTAFVEQIIFQLAPLVKKYPWHLLIIFISLALIIVGGDMVYLRHITKKEISHYRRVIRKYRSFRRKIYTFIINLITLSIITSLYIYYLSDNPESMIRYVWVLIIIFFSLPVPIALIIRNYSYYDYRRRKKEELFEHSLKYELRHFINIQDRNLFDIGKKLSDTISEFVKNNRFVDYSEFYEYIIPIHQELENLDSYYNRKFVVSDLPDTIKGMLTTLAVESALVKASRDYNEFMLVLNSIKRLKIPSGKEMFYIEEELLSGIKDLSTNDMKVIISSESSLVSIYNKLVDLYDYYKSAHDELDNADKDIIEAEKALFKRVQSLSQNGKVIESIRSDAGMVSLYNSLIDIYDNLTKKHESMR